tara:strand:+ start:67 stop:273 length:207 start_codon:yes stop_codon:yes gene_type:complete
MTRFKLGKLKVDRLVGIILIILKVPLPFNAIVAVLKNRCYKKGGVVIFGRPDFKTESRPCVFGIRFIY